MIRYDRAASDELHRLLLPGGLLAPLLERRVVAGLALDVHLREGDEVHVYCGQTRILTARRRQAGARVHGHPSYATQPCAAQLFRDWTSGASGFREALDEYCRAVAVAARWTLGEGAVQAQWAAVLEPWIPFDREAVLGHGKNAGKRPQTLATEAAYAELARELPDEPWACRVKRRLGAEVDQLGIDRDGHLVLLELKDGALPQV